MPIKISSDRIAKTGGNLPFVTERRAKPDNSPIPVLDLFCGTGGFSDGFGQTGKFQVVAGLDIMPDRVSTFSSNHPTADAYCHDIATFKFDESFPDIRPKVIIGGPPCQGFSSIRPFRSENRDDPRNNLFEHFAHAVDELKPEWFVLENVVGLGTHENGRTASRLRAMFEEIGYTLSQSILNAARFGLPQRRERYIVVGNRDGRTFEFPKPTHDIDGKCAGLKPAVTVMDAIGDLPWVSAGCSSTMYNPCSTEYQSMMRRGRMELTMHSATNHGERVLEIIRHAGPNKNSVPDSVASSGFSTSYSRLSPGEPSVTITGNFGFAGSNKCIHPYQDRALTPREAARLQGFWDGYVFHGTRTQICKQIGNAMPPILGKVIGEAMLEQSG